MWPQKSAKADRPRQDRNGLAFMVGAERSPAGRRLVAETAGISAFGVPPRPAPPPGPKSRYSSAQGKASPRAPPWVIRPRSIPLALKGRHKGMPTKSRRHPNRTPAGKTPPSGTKKGAARDLVTGTDKVRTPLVALGNRPPKGRKGGPATTGSEWPCVHGGCRAEPCRKRAQESGLLLTDNC